MLRGEVLLLAEVAAQVEQLRRVVRILVQELPRPEPHGALPARAALPPEEWCVGHGYAARPVVEEVSAVENRIVHLR